VTVHLTDGNLRSRAVILATGARWRHLGVPGEEEYRTRGVTYCPHCDGPLFRGKKVAVIGGGNSGVEAALDLAGVVEHVTVIEFLDELKADEVLLTALGKLDNVDAITGAATTSIDGDGTTVTGLSYTDRASGQDHSIDVSGVFVQIGLLPNTEWLSEAVEINGRGEIVIDERCRTSVPG
ncbi:FAD-dependent oxidoreductase, partial [Cutibacterium acnes]